MAVAALPALPAHMMPFLGESFAASKAADRPMEECGEICSPSQVRTLMDCSARWMFRYLLQLPEPQNGNLALGTAVHAALAYNFKPKVKSGADLPIGEVLSHFDQAWDQAQNEATFRDDENPKELGASGRGLVEKYMLEAAPAIQPAAVECKVEGVIAGVKVQGVLDVIETNGRVRDIKTSGRKSSCVSNEQKFQLATYVPFAPGATGEVVVDQLVKTKTPQLVQLEHTITASDRLATERLYPHAQFVMRSQVYMPNRCSNLCSRKNCAYWRECEREFGGEVEES